MKNPQCQANTMPHGLTCKRESVARAMLEAIGDGNAWASHRVDLCEQHLQLALDGKFPLWTCTKDFKRYPK